MSSRKTGCAEAREPFRAERLQDGRTALHFDGGGRFVYPPLPEGDWSRRKGKELSELNYNVARRLLPEEGDA